MALRAGKLIAEIMREENYYNVCLTGAPLLTSIYKGSSMVLDTLGDSCLFYCKMCNLGMQLESIRNYMEHGYLSLWH